MRSEADEPKHLVMGLFVDQHEVGPDMAVAEVAPRAAQRVVVVSRVEGDIVGEGVHNDGEPFIEVVSVATSGLASVIASEPARPLNRPHEGRQGGC